MESRWAKLGIPAAAIALVVVLFVVLSGGGDDEADNSTAPTTATTEVDPAAPPEEPGTAGEAEGPMDDPAEARDEPRDPTIVVRNGEPADGVVELEYKKGDQIRFRVRSDVAEEVHVHGYDIFKEVEAGGSVGFDFAAEIDGVFEVELEASAVQLAELRVNP